MLFSTCKKTYVRTYGVDLNPELNSLHEACSLPGGLLISYILKGMLWSSNLNPVGSVPKWDNQNVVYKKADK